MIPKSLDTLRIDINSGKVRKAVSICQQDTVQRTLNFLLVNSGNLVDISNVLFAEIIIHKADGAEADNGCVIDGDSIQYTLRTTDVSAIGINQAQLLLTFADGQTLTTPTFEINVYSKVLNQSVQKSQNEYYALTEQLVLVNEMSNQIGAARDTAIAKATEAEASATAAAASEDNALDSAERAEEAYRNMGEDFLVLGETSSTAYRGDRGKIAYDHSQTTGNPHNTTAAQVGADVAGAAAQAYQQAAGYIDTKIADLINGAPSTLDTLKEIADAMAEHEDVVEALNQAIGTKASDIEFQAHQNNTTVHITANERSAWDAKQNATDNSLNTTDKTIVGAINENTSDISQLNHSISSINNDKVYKPSNRPINANPDLLDVALGNNDSPTNQPYYFSTDYGSLVNIPPGVSSTSAFYGWREVHCVMSLTTVTLHEMYPNYGRTWINTFDTNQNAWYGWRHTTPTS